MGVDARNVHGYILENTEILSYRYDLTTIAGMPMDVIVLPVKAVTAIKTGNKFLMRLKTLPMKLLMPKAQPIMPLLLPLRESLRLLCVMNIPF